MVKKSLCSFAFKGLVFDKFYRHRLLIKLVDTKINVTKAAFTDTIRPVEEIMLYFFDSVLIRFIFRYH